MWRKQHLPPPSCAAWQRAGGESRAWYHGGIQRLNAWRAVARSWRLRHLNIRRMAKLRIAGSVHPLRSVAHFVKRLRMPRARARHLRSQHLNAAHAHYHVEYWRPSSVSSARKSRRSEERACRAAQLPRAPSLLFNSICRRRVGRTIHLATARKNARGGCNS